MTRIAQANDRGIDYSGARPNPVATRQAGGAFIVRYSAGAGNADSATHWKLCGEHEIRDAVDAGMDFIANSEWYETRITEGARAGAADGAADLAFWQSRGLARGASVFVSWDAYPNRSQWDAAVAYLQAHQRAMRGYYFTDAYGGTSFLRYALGRKVIRSGWRPNAGSWSGDGLPYQPKITGPMLDRARRATPAAIWQTGNYWWSKQADENVLLRPVPGTHLAALAAAGAPVPGRHAAPTPTHPAPHPAPHPFAYSDDVRIWGTAGDGLMVSPDYTHLDIHHAGRVVGRIPIIKP